MTSSSKKVADAIAMITSASQAQYESEADRKAVLGALQASAERLESPLEKALRLTWYNPPLYAALKIAIDVDLFAKWQSQGDGAKSASELAALTEVDPELMNAILPFFVSMHVLEESGADSFVQTPFTLALAQRDMQGFFRWLFMILFPMFNNLPAFLAKQSYKIPKDTDKAPFGAGLNFDGSFFKFLGQNPSYAQTWNEMMAAYTADVGTWLDFYPVEDLIHSVEGDEKPLLIDVGGGLGQDLERFRKRFPNAKGRLILQDKPEVIEKARKLDGVENMPHDFFREQPIKDSRIIFFHSVLHDWPDEKVIAILNNVKPAMKPGYTRLLLNENVITAREPNPHVTALDLNMISFFATRERDEKTWRHLIKSAGMTIIKIWTSQVAPEAILEVELP